MIMIVSEILLILIILQNLIFIIRPNDNIWRGGRMVIAADCKSVTFSLEVQIPPSSYYMTEW